MDGGAFLQKYHIRVLFKSWLSVATSIILWYVLFSNWVRAFLWAKGLLKTVHLFKLYPVTLDSFATPLQFRTVILIKLAKTPARSLFVESRPILIFACINDLCEQLWFLSRICQFLANCSNGSMSLLLNIILR